MRADAGSYPSRDLSVSVVIPAYNSGRQLGICLKALFAGSELPTEVLVVDDGSTDQTRDIAASFPVKVLTTGRSRGPAFARNFGARTASGDILVFLDSDVCVRDYTVHDIRARFEGDAQLDAVIGSYDSTPQSPDFLSQYRNLMHAYVHQTGAEQASTFWSGCGAIRREVFLEHSGFDERFGRPAIEDIELGYRLVRGGCKITLDRSIQVTHLKRWSFWNLVKTDILDRGIPWTELILRQRFMPNDLNLHLSQRVSVALVFVFLAQSCITTVVHGAFFLIPLFAIVFGLLARWWIEFATPNRSRTACLTLVAVVAIAALLSWSHHMYGIVPPLVLTPLLLFVRHRHANTGRRTNVLRWFAIGYTLSLVSAAAIYIQLGGLTLICFSLLALIGLLNGQFYRFLAGKRGVPFMCAAIPFHLLYHFYNGVSFMGGVARYGWDRLKHERVAIRSSPVRFPTI